MKTETRPNLEVTESPTARSESSATNTTFTLPPARDEWSASQAEQKHPRRNFGHGRTLAGFDEDGGEPYGLHPKPSRLLLLAMSVPKLLVLSWDYLPSQ